MVWHVQIPSIPKAAIPAIHRVNSDKPWLWLAAGWGDFVKAPAISLAYGLVVALMMLTIFQLLQMRGFFLFALALMAGFVFIGPLLAVGLYEISHRLEQQLPVRLYDTWRGWRRNRRSLFGIGMVMTIIVLGWFVVSSQVTAMAYAMSGDEAFAFAARLDWQSFFLSIRWPMVISFSLIGLTAVTVAYVLMVVSVPMLTDKEEMDTITAMVVSLHTVRKNPSVLILWAVLIAAFTGLGVAPIFLGLILVFPLLAYSSWHAYRDLIEH